MKIFVGSDHAGFGFKEKLKVYLEGLGHEVVDKGPFEYDENDDFPDYIIPVSQEVSNDPERVRGIILGGSGQGEAMTANKFSHVRAAVYYGPKESQTSEEHESIVAISRLHNDSNILSIGARFVNEDEMKEAVREWLETAFLNTDKYVRRNVKMEHIHG
jgi:ribose 5-phosphate isomerase B